MWQDFQTYTSAIFTTMKYSLYCFLLDAQSTTGNSEVWRIKAL